jgi:hypothetical protein
MVKITSPQANASSIYSAGYIGMTLVCLSISSEDETFLSSPIQLQHDEVREGLMDAILLLPGPSAIRGYF